MDLPSCCFLVLFLILATSGFDRNIESRAEVIDVNLRRLAVANNKLAVNIYHQLTRGSNKTVFFSPLTLSTAFGMLYYGTRGDTSEELRNALGYNRAGLEEGLVHRTFQKYLTEFLPSQDTTAYTLNSANVALIGAARFGDSRQDLVPGYKTEVQDYYQASVQDVDFATRGPEVFRQINDLVQEKTNGKIDKLLEDLDAFKVLVLLNAVYFKGTWKTEFDPVVCSATERCLFFNNGLKTGGVKTAMMVSEREFLYVSRDDIKVIEMPYKGDNISMLILLPIQPDGWKSLETLTATKFSELRSQLEKKYFKVKMPKFKVEFSKDLSGEFQALGANKIFGPAADFSGITTAKMAVSQVLHKAVIEVNEEGSEAAVVVPTDVNSGKKKSPISHIDFTVNRPFLFAIIDRRNDMILFMGRVTNL